MVGEQVVRVADHDGGARRVDRQRVAPAGAAPRHPPPLPDGDQLDRVDGARGPALGVDQPARAQRHAGREERGAATRRGDEADVLAVGLGRGAQAQGPGVAPHLGLGQLAHRQQAAGQLLTAQDRQDIGLVLGPVPAPHQSAPAPGRGDHAGVVARRHRVEAELAGPAQEAVELQVAVAVDAGVRRTPGGVGGHVGLHHPGVEVGREVEDVVGDAQLLGHAPGVVHVGHRAAPRVAGAAPQLHGGPDHVVAGLGQKGGGDRRVHAPRHGHQHPHLSRPAAGPPPRGRP